MTPSLFPPNAFKPPHKCTVRILANLIIFVPSEREENAAVYLARRRLSPKGVERRLML